MILPSKHGHFPRRSVRLPKGKIFWTCLKYTVEEILHQLTGGLSHYLILFIGLKVVQDFYPWFSMWFKGHWGTQHPMRLGRCTDTLLQSHDGSPWVPVTGWWLVNLPLWKMIEFVRLDHHPNENMGKLYKKWSKAPTTWGIVQQDSWDSGWQSWRWWRYEQTSSRFHQHAHFEQKDGAKIQNRNFPVKRSRGCWAQQDPPWLVRLQAWHWRPLALKLKQPGFSWSFIKKNIKLQVGGWWFSDFPDKALYLQIPLLVSIHQLYLKI